VECLPVASVNMPQVSLNLRKRCREFRALLYEALAIIIIDMNVSCHRYFLPGTSLEPAVIPTAQASSFTLQYFIIIIIIIIIITL